MELYQRSTRSQRSTERRAATAPTPEANRAPCLHCSRTWCNPELEARAARVQDSPPSPLYQPCEGSLLAAFRSDQIRSMVSPRSRGVRTPWGGLVAILVVGSPSQPSMLERYSQRTCIAPRAVTQHPSGVLTGRASAHRTYVDPKQSNNVPSTNNVSRARSYTRLL